MPLKIWLSVLLLIKLHVGGYSFYLWVNELCEGQCWPGHINGVLPRNYLPVRAGQQCCHLGQLTPRRINPSWVGPVCCFQLFQQIKLLHGMMEGKMGNEEELLPPTGITQEAQTGQRSKGPQSPGGKKFRTVPRPSDKAKWRDWLPTDGPKPGLSRAKSQQLQNALRDSKHLCVTGTWYIAQPALDTSSNGMFHLQMRKLRQNRIGHLLPVSQLMNARATLSLPLINLDFGKEERENCCNVKYSNATLN